MTKIAYRIFNKLTNKYEPNMFISQDGTKLMKSGWINPIPITDDYILEPGIELEGQYIYENDILIDDEGFIDIVKFDEIDKTLCCNGANVFDLYDIRIIGNANYTTLKGIKEELKEE